MNSIMCWLYKLNGIELERFLNINFTLRKPGSQLLGNNADTDNELVGYRLSVIGPVPFHSNKQKEWKDLFFAKCIRREEKRQKMGCAASISEIPVASQSNNVFSSCGIKLSWLKKQMESMDQTFLRTATIKDVCEKLIKPYTKKYLCSYCDFLKATYPEAVGTPSVYVIHTWKYNFNFLILTLTSHFAKEQDFILWIDLFSINQHISRELSFNFLSVTLKSTIAEIGRSVVLTNSWDEIIPLQRAWCVWELYCTLNGNGILEIAIPVIKQDNFIKAIDSNPEQFLEELSLAIDCFNSQCSDEEDLKIIHKMIEQTINFPALNRLIFNGLRKEITSRYSREFERRKKRSGVKDLVILNAMSTLAILLLREENYQEAEEHLLVCLKNRTELLGEDHSDTIATLDTLARLYDKLENTELAEEYYQRSLEKRIISLGENHLDSLKSMETLAIFYNKIGDYEKGGLYLEECYSTKAYTLGESHPETLSSMKELAEAYDRLGDQEKAEELYSQCLNQQSKTLGENHFSTISTLKRLANLHFSKGQYVKSERFMRKCYWKLKKQLGEAHQETLEALHQLAILQRKMKNSLKALVLIRDCLGKQKTVLGSSHPDTLGSNVLLAQIYCDLNVFAQSESVYLDCIGKLKATYGELHPLTLKLTQVLGTVYEKQGRVEESEQVFLDCYEKQKSLQGEFHPDTVGTMNLLVNLYLLQKDFSRAEHLLNISLEQIKTILGENHFETVNCANNLGLLLSEQGKYEAAETSLRTVLEQQKALFGQNSIEVLKTMKNLIFVYEKQKKLDSALQLAQESYQAHVAQFGELHLNTSIAMNLLVNVYFQLEDFSCCMDFLYPLISICNSNEEYGSADKGLFEEYLEKYSACLKLFQLKVGSNHPDLLKYMSKLADLYYDHGYPERAEILYLEYTEIEIANYGSENLNPVVVKMLSLLKDSDRGNEVRRVELS
jgi:tetratricopeptide (TPR) repeat protein